MLASSLVLVNSENSNAVELRKLRQEDEHHGHKVRNKVGRVVFCVEADQEKSADNNGKNVPESFTQSFTPNEFQTGGKVLQDDGHNRQKLARPCELNPIVNLLPMGQASGQSLILNLPRGAFKNVENDEVDLQRETEH